MEQGPAYTLGKNTISAGPYSKARAPSLLLFANTVRCRCLNASAFVITKILCEWFGRLWRLRRRILAYWLASFFSVIRRLV